jgi:hypothetical protein
VPHRAGRRKDAIDMALQSRPSAFRRESCSGGSRPFSTRSPSWLERRFRPEPVSAFLTFALEVEQRVVNADGEADQQDHRLHGTVGHGPDVARDCD